MIFSFEQRRLFLNESGPKSTENNDRLQAIEPQQESDPLKNVKGELRELATMPTQDSEEKGIIQQALFNAKGKYNEMQESVIGSIQEQVNNADKWFTEKAEEMVQGAEILAPMIAKAYRRMTPEQRAPIDHYLHKVDDRLKTEYGSSLKEVSEFFENMPPEEREKLAKDLIPGSDLKDAWNGDKLSTVFLVGSIFPIGKLGKLAKLVKEEKTAGKLGKTVEKIETVGIPGMTDAKIKPHEMRKFLQDETQKLGDISGLSSDGIRKRFDEVLGNLGVMAKYIKNADNNSALSAAERLSAKEALRDEILVTLKNLESNTSGIRTSKQTEQFIEIINQLK